jgi:hypothetical protein
MKLQVKVKVLTSLLWAMTATHGPVLAAIGDLDPGYGGGGRVVTGVPAGALGDGSLIYSVASTATGFTDYVHADINGQPDPLFGVAGRLSLPLNGLGNATHALRTPAGQLLFSVRQNGYVSLLRLDATGYPDPSFGTAGIVNIAALTTSCGNDIVDGLAFQPDGHLLTLVSNYGNSYFNDVLVSVAIRRFDTNGSLDPVFGNGAGVVTLALASCSDGGIEGTATLDVLDSGAMDIALPVTHSYFSADGAPLTGPSVSPGLRTDIGEWQFGGILPNGDLLLTAGAPTSGTVIARVHQDGTLDKAFGDAGTGYAQLNIAALVSSEAEVTERVQITRISADGKHIYMLVLLARQCDYCSNGETLGLVVARLLAQGSQAGTLDSSFGNDGVVLLAKADALKISDIVEQSGGAVVLTSSGSAIRLLGDATPSPGVVGIAGDYFLVPTSQGVAQVRVARTLGKDGAVSVSFATSDGLNADEAIAGKDYTAVSGRLDWADGDSTDKLITIPVFHVGADSKPLNVRLTSPTGGAWIISTDQPVYIDGNASAPSSAPTPTPSTSPASPARRAAGRFDPWSIGLL